MRLIILQDAETVGEWAARFVARRVAQHRPSAARPFVLGLPTGGTPQPMYRHLVRLHRAGRLSFRHVHTFNMDEYVGLPRDHPESYHHYMWRELFQHVDIDPRHAHLLDGNAPDLRAECERYERAMAELGGVTLFIGGIGPDGHVAFNEPGSSLASRTRVKTLAHDTLLANRRFFEGELARVPRRALTVGVGTVMAAREVAVLVTGAHKAQALAHAVEGGVHHMWTVSAMQQHPRALLLADEDATQELRVKTVNYFKSLMVEHNKLLDESDEESSAATEEVAVN